MKSYFGEILWEALTRPFKLQKNSEVWKWVKTQGLLMDDIREEMFQIRRSWYARYASGWALDLRGAERGIIRWYGEDDDSYRRRVDAAYLFWAAGGTRPGMLAALKQIGYDVEIEERVPSWAKFKLEFDFFIGQPMGRMEWDILNFTVFRMKPAHTLPWYVMNFRPKPPQTWKITQRPIIKGQIGTTQVVLWNTKRFYYLDGSLTLNGSITLGDGWAEALYLDGAYLLSGETRLDGFTAIEGDGWRWRDNPISRPKMIGTIQRVGPYANQLYWLDGREVLDGSLFLDGKKETNSKWAHHRTFAERFDNSGNSLGREELH